MRNLPASAPDVLEESIALRKAVHAVVALAHGAYEAAEGVGLVLAGVAAVLVDLGDGELDGGVVLGLDDTVGCAALAWDVPRGAVLVIFAYLGSVVGCDGGAVQVNELAAFVLHFGRCVGFVEVEVSSGCSTELAGEVFCRCVFNVKVGVALNFRGISDAARVVVIRRFADTFRSITAQVYHQSRYWRNSYLNA